MSNQEAATRTHELERKLGIALTGLREIAMGYYEGSSYGAAQRLLERLGQPLTREEALQVVLKRLELAEETMRRSREKIQRL